jgi:hypothetical protein
LRQQKFLQIGYLVAYHFGTQRLKELVFLRFILYEKPQGDRPFPSLQIVFAIHPPSKSTADRELAPAIASPKAAQS